MCGVQSGVIGGCVISFGHTRHTNTLAHVYNASTTTHTVAPICGVAIIIIVVDVQMDLGDVNRTPRVATA